MKVKMCKTVKFHLILNEAEMTTMINALNDAEMNLHVDSDVRKEIAKIRVELVTNYIV